MYSNLHFTKQSWRASSEVSCITFDEFVFMSSVVLKQYNFRKKSREPGLESGKAGREGASDFWHKTGELSRLSEQTNSHNE